MTTIPNDLAGPLDSPVSAVSWSAIFAGAVAAAAVTLILLALGSGLGLAVSAHAPSLTTFGAAAAIWLIVTQWVSAYFGGYLTGRLRSRWAGTHSHEVFFRDTAHGFLSWALAAVAATVVIGPALASAAGEAANAAGPVAATDAARKAASALSIYTALSMLVGAFIASVAAAMGGHERDKHP